MVFLFSNRFTSLYFTCSPAKTIFISKQSSSKTKLGANSNLKEWINSPRYFPKCCFHYFYIIISLDKSSIFWVHFYSHVNGLQAFPILSSLHSLIMHFSIITLEVSDDPYALGYLIPFSPIIAKLSLFFNLNLGSHPML